ncbi:N-6 DNA methylase [Pseudomonas sp.]|uniref:N-6 DNA methylase n=1 Tax=Pseudomonas sp. TaxID=306 RepID=UPI0031D2C8BD
MGQVLAQGIARPQRTDALGRYYTKPDIGSLLVDQMDGHIPRRLLDLGAGAGSLSSAAYNRWRDIDLLTVDIDAVASSHLEEKFTSLMGERHFHYQADVLSDQLFEILGAGLEIDTALCNPPFTAPEWRSGFSEMLESAGFSGCLPVLSEVDAALLFLAQNLRLTSEAAKVGIILPDTLISASKYKTFREVLLDRYSVEKVVRLPRRAFQKTDALASIVILNKGRATGDEVPLYRFSSEVGISQALFVPKDAAIARLDYEYHSHHVKGLQGEKSKAISELGVELKRGWYSSSQLKNMSAPVLHTSNLNESSFGKWMDFSSYSISDGDYAGLGSPVRASPGDIIIARVGRNLESKIVGVESGFPMLSDCLYRLRCPANHRDNLLRQLCSEAGQAWIVSRVYGVSARQLSKSDLMGFPLSF